jgi:hypothetical protein
MSGSGTTSFTQPGLDRRARHAAHLCGRRVLCDDNPAVSRDGLDAVGRVASTTGQHHGHDTIAKHAARRFE